VKILGEFDIAKFKVALARLLERHEVLRCGFHHNDEGVFITVSQDCEIPIKVLPVSDLYNALLR